MHHTRPDNIQTQYHVPGRSVSRVWCVTTGADVSRMRNKVVTCIWKWSSGAGMVHGAWCIFLFLNYLSIFLVPKVIPPEPMTWNPHCNEPLWAGLAETGKMWLSRRNSACISETRGEKGVDTRKRWEGSAVKGICFFFLQSKTQVREQRDNKGMGFLSIG